MVKIEKETAHRVILDAGPLIHLNELDSLDILGDFKELLLPEAVWKVVERHRPTALSVSGVSFTRIQIRQEMEPQILILCAAFGLDKGEEEAIAACRMHSDALLLTDDSAARLAAKSLGIRAYGTIGVLLRSVRRSLLVPVDVLNILERIPEKSTIFIKRTLLNEIIEEFRKFYEIK